MPRGATPRGIHPYNLIFPVIENDADVVVQTRDEWLASRKKYVTGTDFAAILGLSPYAKLADIALKKRGLAPETTMTEAMEWGVNLEETVADHYAKVTGCYAVSIEAQYLLVSKEHPWLAGTPDRICVKGGNIWGLEVKTASRKDGWAESLLKNPYQTLNTREDVPLHYYIQIQAYMALLPSIKRWDLAVLIGGNDFRAYRFGRDEDMITTILEVGKMFYDDYVADQETPISEEVIATSEKACAMLYPTHVAGKIIDAHSDDHFRRVAAGYSALSKHIAKCEAVKSTVRGMLVSKLTDAESAVFDGGKVTYKNTKSTMKVDYEAKYNLLMSTLPVYIDQDHLVPLKEYMECEGAQAQYTRTAPGARRLLVTIKEDAEPDIPTLMEFINGESDAPAEEV
jgi:putative phage-type endonuclease